MSLTIIKYSEKELGAMVEIWNEVVRAGLAFPQEEELGLRTGADFFAAQSYCGVGLEHETGQTVGLYILHPNNVGRCGHICNASYAVRADCRGRGHGADLVRHSLATAASLGFRIMQFNAVVAGNTRAHKLYASLGFTPLGIIPGGFRLKDGTYRDIHPYYKILSQECRGTAL